MRENGFATGIMYILMVFLAVGLAVLIFFNFQANSQQQAEIEAAEALAAATATPEPTGTPEPTATPSRNTETVTLAFAGDIVGQAGLTTDAATVTTVGEGDEAVESTSYDYYDELAGVTSSLSGADFAACTLVGTLSASGAYEDGYGMNSAMARALSGAGFGLVNLATDHILEQGLDGLVATVNVLENEGIQTSGAHKSQETKGIYMANVQGVQVAVLSYTYGTGGVSVVDNPWCVDILTTDYMTEQTAVDYDTIDADIRLVKNAGADIVVCFVYWWDNTQYYPIARDNQTEVVSHLFETGVDIVIGGGVKTPQPMELRTVERPDGTKANCVVCYSLSNLMSCFNDKYTNLSATAKIEISRDTDTGDTWISGLRYDPLFMLDTDDYDGYDEPGYKYRLLDAYEAVNNYDGGSRSISEATYEAIKTGIEDLQSLMGAEYDSASGGVTVEYPY